MKRLNESPLLTDAQLNEIIDSPRPGTERLTSDDLLIYFDTMNGTVQPSWMYMDKTRMKVIFNRFINSGWIQQVQINKVEAALRQL